VSVIEAPGDAAGERRNDEHRRDEPGSASTNGTGSKESRPVEVRIGTIEVSSASSPEPAPGMAPPPSLKGFDDHLYVRSYIDIARL
jgi:hypothetical protein